MTEIHPCPHSRPTWRSCPHCLGLNNLPTPTKDKRVSGMYDEIKHYRRLERVSEFNVAMMFLAVGAVFGFIGGVGWALLFATLFLGGAVWQFVLARRRPR